MGVVVPYEAPPAYSLAAGEGLRLDFGQGKEWFRFLSATGDLLVGFDGADPERLPVGIGVRIPGGFRVVYIQNDTAAALSFQVAATTGESTDNRLSLGGVTVPVEVIGSGALTGSGQIARATAGHDTIAANTSRKAISIQADPNNTGDLVLRDASGKAFGVLAPGASWRENVTAAIQVRNDTGAAQNYYYSEVE